MNNAIPSDVLLADSSNLAGKHTSASPDSVMLSFSDVNGVLRGKSFTADAFDGICRRNNAVFTNLLLALDPLDTPITTFQTFGINSGAQDLIVRPDRSTLRRLPWSYNAAICFGDLYWDDGSPCELSARGTLKRALDRLQGHGFNAFSAFEFEVRVFKGAYGEPATDGLSYGVLALSPLEAFIDEIRRCCDELDLGLSAVHTEGAPGLLEINLEPSVGILAADKAVLLRLLLKELARRNGLHVSFMAKAAAGEEGSSGHLHCSLLTSDGRNAFPGDRPGLSTLLRQAVAGIVRHLPAMSLLYNPTINSYKRLVPGFFAPVDAAWGIDNRAAAARVIVPEHREGTRVELRRPGADVNPYLGLAALVISICLGIEHNLEAPAAIGTPGAQAAPLPGSLEQAISEFAADIIARDALGQAFSDYFLETRKWEIAAWQKSVSEWERTRYFQIT